jgi:cytochrome c oxidase assembly protein subunit 15
MNWIKRLARIELVLIYLVIIAGSVVRMTGSGMGCPDWPKCFGYLIPPTEKSQLEWTPEHEFKKGQIIIVNEELKVANQNFTSSSTYQNSNWNSYTKHDYAIFNPFHTWTEYINRLIGALSGIPMLLLLVLSIFKIKTDWRFALLSFAGLFMLGFEAWLGKLVVDGNLIPGSITIHMLGALILIILISLIIGIPSACDMNNVRRSKGVRNLIVVTLVLTLVQIIIGTQIREQVDVLKESGMLRSSWISSLDWQFYFHRSFSILIVVLNGWLWWKNKQEKAGITEMNLILAIIGMEVLLGIILNYFSMPKLAQPSHLLLGTILFGLQFYALIRYYLAPKLVLQSR